MVESFSDEALELIFLDAMQRNDEEHSQIVFVEIFKRKLKLYENS